jgi:DNA modification methylase
MCGDSLNNEDVEKLMFGKGITADMVFTDPPYGINFQSCMMAKEKRHRKIENDKTILDIAPVIKQFSTGFVFVWTSWKVLER